MHKGTFASVTLALSALLGGCSSSGSMSIATAEAPLALTPQMPAVMAPPQASASGLRAVSTPRYTTNDDPHMIAASVRPAPTVAIRQSSTPITASTSTRDLKVMTFNLRVATAFDLTNTWDLRRAMVVERVHSFDPDMLGTQEGLHGMEKYLQEQLAEYTFFGVGRNDGREGGEMVGVFYKSAKFDQLDGGHFWLSENPEKPGTRGWGAWFPRMVTWVKLRPRDGGQPFVWFNTHFDAFAGKARVQSAHLLLERMTGIAGSLPCIVTGDFNADQGSEPYRILCSRLTGAGPQLIDVFRVTHPHPDREEGTMHSFHGSKDGVRMDWILTTQGFQAIHSEIDHTRGLLGYPSDHFPVEATIRPTNALTVPTVARIE